MGPSRGRAPGCSDLKPAGPWFPSSGMARNSEGELLLVTTGAVGGQGLASSVHCMGRQETSPSPRWQCPDRHSSTATDGCGALGRLVELSHGGGKPVQSQTAPSTAPTPPRLLSTRSLGLSGCTLSSVSPSSPGTRGTICLQASLVPPITHPVRAGLRAPLPCNWAQHPPNTPTASIQCMSLLPSWHCSCHTPFLSPGAWSNQQCRAMAPHSTQLSGTRRSQKEILDS